jgi:hypothetical protein
MNVKHWIASIAFAAAAPVALAAPATLTVTSTGTVLGNYLHQYTGIAAGSAYTLTMTASYDTNDLDISTWSGYRNEETWAYASAALTIGDKTYTLASDSPTTLSANWRDSGGEQRLSIDFRFMLGNDNYTYWATQPVKWPQGGATLDSLLTGNADVTFAAPFALGASASEYSSGEPVGDLYLNVASTHITVSAVPEPQTWGMMLGGLAIAGAVARRRQRADQPA